MINLETALVYLRDTQQILAFSDEFLSRIEVKSAVLQAVLDAAGREFSAAEVQRYKEAQTNWIVYGGPNDQLPLRSHIAGAQKLVYEFALRQN